MHRVSFIPLRVKAVVGLWAVVWLAATSAWGQVRLVDVAGEVLVALNTVRPVQVIDCGSKLKLDYSLARSASEEHPHFFLAGAF